MIKMILEKINQLESTVKQIMKYGFRFSFFVCLISTLLLLSYGWFKSPDLYYIGLSVFQLSLFFIVEFIICGIAIDTIKKQRC